MDTPNIGSHAVPGLFARSYGTQEHYVLAGEYVGPAAPGLIEVTIPGRQAAATIVEVPGQDRWVAWYLVLPGPAPAPDVTPGVTAYDTAGQPLTSLGADRGAGGAANAS
jgi:hypothetical protein